MRAPPRSALIVAQLVGAAVLIYFVGRTIAEQWNAFRSQPLTVAVGATELVVSGVIVLATYALLIQVWRVLITAARASLSFWRAARIWSVAGLWKWVPGKVWGIGALATMANKEQVPPVAAAGAALLSNVLNIATGMAVSLVLAWRWIGEWNRDAQPVAIVLLLVGLAGLVALPYLLPRMGSIAARVTGRDIQLHAPPPWALAIAVLGNLISWAMYGLAFMWLVRALLGDAVGPAWQYVAVFTTSYVVGYLFLFAPAGIGPREAVMWELMVSLNLAGPKEAALVVVGSRIWLTILETVPGVLFLARGAMQGRSIQRPPDGTQTR